jgi:uncharacterized protein (TIGR04255 family)
LVRVIAQVKFPAILAVADPGVVAPFQDLIRSAYPLGTKDLVHRIEIGAASPEPAAVKAEAIWRFNSRQSDWRVSLAPDFFALETTRYTSRRDFLDRVATLADSLERTINPQISLRVGLRYINRIENNAVDQVGELIEHEILGCQETVFGTAARHLITDTVLNTAEGALLHARWGLLPPNITGDAAVEPVPGRSWILDLDMYSEAQADFSRTALIPQLESYAERIYAVFRHITTDAFLAYYGAGNGS